MKKFIQIVALFFTALTLAGCSSDSNVDKWFDIQFKKQGFSFNVAKQLDMIPPIKESGKIKFIPSGYDSELLVIGYVIDLDTAPLDIAKIPQEYTKPWKIMVMGKEYEEQPIKKLSMKLKVLLELKDKDGFSITKLDDINIETTSGEGSQNNKNTYQGKLMVGLTKDLVKQVKFVEGQVVIDECTTCNFLLK